MHTHSTAARYSEVIWLSIGSVGFWIVRPPIRGRIYTFYPIRVVYYFISQSEMVFVCVEHVFSHQSDVVGMYHSQSKTSWAFVPPPIICLIYLFIANQRSGMKMHDCIQPMRGRRPCLVRGFDWLTCYLFWLASPKSVTSFYWLPLRADQFSALKGNFSAWRTQTERQLSQSRNPTLYWKFMKWPITVSEMSQSVLTPCNHLES